jgi:glycosyltransferase involved in cell wall biosynthesis
VPGTHLAIAERDAMAMAIVELLNDPSRGKRLAENGRRLATEVYDWARVGRLCVEAVNLIV